MKQPKAGVIAILLSLSVTGFAESQSQKAPSLSEASAKIDAMLNKGLKEHGLKPCEPLDDAGFLRRTYLDIAGRIPTIEEAEAFHGSSYENKRERLVEDLLSSEGYVSHYYNFWADVLRINAGLGTGAGPAEAAYQLWVKEALRSNKPYDEFIYEMISATGYVWENGAMGYYQRDRGMPLDNMSNTVRTFLGTRLECAQCHNHPFDKWTQMDYFEMAAFSYGMDANRYETPNRTALSQYQNDERQRLYEKAVKIEGFPFIRDDRSLKSYVGNKNYPRYLEKLGMTDKQFREAAQRGMAASASFDDKSNEMRFATNELYRQIRYINVSELEKTLKLPHDYQYSDAKPHDPVKAATMFGAEIDLENIDETAIEAYAKWMTSKENPTFTKVIANRLWKKVFGMGLFEPIDELTDQTQVSNPELLAYLEDLMRSLDYDMKAYLAVLYNTKTYQRVADGNELVLGEPYYFPGPVLRRMSAEQIWDSIVALALPEADHYQPRIKSQLTSIERIRQMYMAIEGLKPEEYIAMTQELGKALSDNLPKQDEVRKNLYKAREAEDDQLYQKLRTELSTLQRDAQKMVTEIGFRHMGEKVDSDKLLAAVGMSEMSMAAMGTEGAEDKAVLTQLPKPKFPEMPKDLDRDQQKRWKQQQSDDYKVYSQLIAGMARASELESPARRGHFLREFGQSDREVIENAADSASVPQALNLLNGTISEALTNRFAVFGSRITEAGDPEEKTRMIFQAMLTREPNDREMALAKSEIERDGDEAYEGLVWALLNTQQFLFVQ